MKKLSLQRSRDNSTVAMSTATVGFNVGDIDSVASVPKIRLPLKMCKK